jgi:hypothetical protein
MYRSSQGEIILSDVVLIILQILECKYWSLLKPESIRDLFHFSSVFEQIIHRISVIYIGLANKVWFVSSVLRLHDQ